MKFKVQADRYEPALCANCAEGVVSVRRNGETRTMCGVMGPAFFVPPDIVRCTDFQDKRDVSKWDMEKIAWEVRHDRSGAILGFAPPKKDK